MPSFAEVQAGVIKLGREGAEYLFEEAKEHDHETDFMEVARIECREKLESMILEADRGRSRPTVLKVLIKRCQATFDKRLDDLLAEKAANDASA